MIVAGYGDLLGMVDESVGLQFLDGLRDSMLQELQEDLILLEPGSILLCELTRELNRLDVEFVQHLNKVLNLNVLLVVGGRHFRSTRRTLLNHLLDGPLDVTLELHNDILKTPQFGCEVGGFSSEPLS